MLDINPPSFTGSDHEKVEQMEKYINELYEAINRKVSCMSIEDFNQSEKNILTYVLRYYSSYPHGYE